MGDCSSSLDPPRTTQDHVQVKISSEEEDGEDDQLTVSQLSPSKTVRGGRDHAERSGWNEESAGPTAGTPLAVSPMRPSKKRASSAGQESDNEPDSARPDEWEKQRLVVQSNREGEVRGGGEGKQDEGTRREADGEKALLASRKKSREGSSSLTLTRRLKAKAVRESPRVRKLRDKLAGRVGAGRRRPVMGDATHVSRGGHACGFPGNAGASTTPSVATVQGKGSDRTSFDETTGPSMPYSGDNVSFVFFSRLGCQCDYLTSDELTFNYAPAFLMTNGFTWPSFALKLDCDQKEKRRGGGWGGQQVQGQRCGGTLFPLHIETKHGAGRVSI